MDEAIFLTSDSKRIPYCFQRGPVSGQVDYSKLRIEGVALMTPASRADELTVTNFNEFLLYARELIPERLEDSARISLAFRNHGESPIRRSDGRLFLTIELLFEHINHGLHFSEASGCERYTAASGQVDDFRNLFTKRAPDFYGPNMI